MADRRERVVVLGGGAGGLELACELADCRTCEVVLVDCAASHVWKPRLHEFAAGTVDSTLSEMSFYVLASLRGFEFEQGRVISVDRDARTVRLDQIESEDGTIRTPARDIAYDRLVISLGGVTPDFGTAGVAQNAVRLDERPDASEFRDLFINALLRARESGQPADVVIVGSGATGTELAAHLRASERGFFNRSVKERRQELLRIMIVEAAPEIMPGVGGELRRAVQDRLADLRIGVETGAKIASVERDAVVSADGKRWPADITVWAAGLVGSPCLAKLADFEIDRKGRIVVGDRLTSSIDERVYVLGDAASLVPEGEDAPLPPTAQCASQQAAYLADAIPSTIAGKTPKPFRFAERGRLISLGLGGSVGSVNLFRSKNDLFVHGQFATAAYRGIQRHHQWVILGKLRGTVAIFADAISPTGGPPLKLHG